MTDVTAVGIFAYYLPRSVYRKIATPVLRHWFAMTKGGCAAALLALRAAFGGCALYTPAGVVVRNDRARRSRIAFPSREGGAREACDG